MVEKVFEIIFTISENIVDEILYILRKIKLHWKLLNVFADNIMIIIIYFMR
jgi:hypothetical protein